MLIILIFVLGSAILLWVGYPFWLKRLEVENTPDQGALQDLLFQKEELLATARDLDLDLLTDKISAEDHRVLRDHCQSRAVAVMGRLETLASLKRNSAGNDGGAVEERWTRWAGENPDGGESKFCSNCGSSVARANQFCTNCGSPLKT